MFNIILHFSQKQGVIIVISNYVNNTKIEITLYLVTQLKEGISSSFSKLIINMGED